MICCRFCCHFCCRFCGHLDNRSDNTKSICRHFWAKWSIASKMKTSHLFVVVLSLLFLMSRFFFAGLRFFRSLSRGARRRFTRRSSTEHRNHAAQQVTKLRSMARRIILSNAVRHDSGVLSHHARIEDRLPTFRKCYLRTLIVPSISVTFVHTLIVPSIRTNEGMIIIKYLRTKVRMKIRRYLRR